jgi:heme-degrading monooxygenase HmoA
LSRGVGLHLLSTSWGRGVFGKGEVAMFMRLVQLKVKSGRVGSYQQFYRGRIIPTLAKVRGCRYAALIQSMQHPEECLSLTLWDGEEDALAYERAGLFDRLLAGTRPYLVESAESKLQLSEDLTLEYVPIPAEPVVTRLPVAEGSGSPVSHEGRRSSLCVRILSLRLRPGKRAEFDAFYRNAVIPALRGVNGCLQIYLAERTDRVDEVLSVTTWEKKEDAEAYEASGLFARLLESQRETLSELYDWKLGEQKKTAGALTTSEDPTIERFEVIVGRVFRQSS